MPGLKNSHEFTQKKKKSLYVQRRVESMTSAKKGSIAKFDDHIDTEREK